MYRPARLATVLAGLLLVTACQGGPAGDEARAAQAADDFLRMLAEGRAQEAWVVLTPATRQAVYGGDPSLFADDVLNADWSGVKWAIQDPPVALEILWGVHVTVDGGSSAVPDFLLERAIVDLWQEADGAEVMDRGIVVFVQETALGTWVVPGVGLGMSSRAPDTDQRAVMVFVPNPAVVPHRQRVGIVPPLASLDSSLLPWFTEATSS